MGDLISKNNLVKQLKHHKELFCRNRIEFLGLSKNDKARVDEIDNCIATVINMPSAQPEPCDDAVSREAAIDAALSAFSRGLLASPDIRKLPSVQPERKKGEWQITDAYPHNVYCSECHTRFAQTHWAVWEDGSLPRNFCPNCGSYNGGDDHDL